MATNDNNNGMDDDEMCCIEATVVSGFEECARGEAKEKFNATVKAARGKISWEIPIRRVNEVVQMGSIDNCRVILKNVPHFGFTDQHDSLARLQKLVAELDWNRGLSVWRRFNDFPHPIDPKPDLISSVDDLVDVVVVDIKTRSQGGAKDKKSKKGGRGKKKEKNWKKNKGGGKAAEPAAEVENKESSESNAGVTPNSNVCEKQDEEHHNSSFDENGTKKVVIKQFDPNEPAPEINITVLIPGPDENVFPSDVSDKDQREVEPMDVDHSMHQKPEDLGSTPVKSVPVSIPGSECKENEKEGVKDEDVKPQSPTASPFKHPSAAINILTSAKDFATSVIAKLKSPHQIPESDVLSSSPLCVTPPPTPVQQQGLEFYMKSREENDSTVSSSSVDPSHTPVVAVTASSGEGKVKGSDFGALVNADSCKGDSDKTESSQKTQDSPAVGEKPCDSSNNATEEKQKETDVVDSSAVVKKERDPTKPTFRVTCNRVGENHSFDSTSAAASVGSAVIRYFDWSVNLKNFDIEVLVNIENEEVTFGIGITRSSLHNRNLVAFGPTTLRATIAYNMLRLCRIRKGDFVCDPMCGTSAIPIEGSLNWVHSFFFSGDHHDKGIERSLVNINTLQKRRSEEKKDHLKMDTVQWDIEHFPLRDRCVDVFVSDLPFGYRMGSRTANRTLYPTLLNAMARTARSGARACLLTEDKTSLIKALQMLGQFWQRRVILSINMGGLSGFVFLLTRTTATYSIPEHQPWRKEDLPATAQPPTSDRAAPDGQEELGAAGSESTVCPVTGEAETGEGDVKTAAVLDGETGVEVGEASTETRPGKDGLPTE